MPKPWKPNQDSFSWEPKTANQVILRDTIRKKRITLAVGPAGTGKTLVSMCVALEELIKGERNGGVDGIVLSRPLVVTGNNFGFLPGTIQEKIDPYMEPLIDTILDLNVPNVQQLLEGECSPIESVPLELMRGKTFKNKFIIIDEAQNCTPKQIEMAMTRLGQGSRMVFCGDTMQSDLRSESGLSVALNLFGKESEFGIAILGLNDIMREGITRTVIEKFSKFFGGNNA